MMAMPAEVPAEVPAHWLAYFGTADCDATVAAATGRRSHAVVGPIDIPAGRFAVLADPAGAMFAVIALAGGLDAPTGSAPAAGRAGRPRRRTARLL